MNGIIGTPFNLLLGFHKYLRGYYYIGMIIYFIVFAGISF